MKIDGNEIQELAVPTTETAGEAPDLVVGQPPDRIFIGPWVENELEFTRRRADDEIEYLCRDFVLAAFPTSWLDSLLTGPNAVVGKPPFGCPDVERLLRAIKARVTSE